MSGQAAIGVGTNPLLTVERLTMRFGGLVAIDRSGRLESSRHRPRKDRLPPDNADSEPA